MQSCYSDDMAGNKPADLLVWFGVTHQANQETKMADRDQKQLSGATNVNRRGRLCQGNRIAWKRGRG